MSVRFSVALGFQELGKQDLRKCSYCVPEGSLTQHRCLAFESLHRLQTADKSALAFVYCDYTIPEEQTAVNLIGSLLGQLINQLPHDHPLVNELLERHSSNKLLDIASGVDYIRRICMLDSFSAVRLGADGLDELLPEHRSCFLDQMGTLSRISKVQFLFFGRDYAGIQGDVDSSFITVRNAPVHFKIIGTMTVHDRQLFLLEKLRRHKNGRTFDQTLQNLILDTIASIDSTYAIIYPGMYENLIFYAFRFLLALFRIQDVLSQESPGKASAAVKSIKADLSIVYESMIGRIDTRSRELLQWVLFATRPLTLDELGFAITIKTGMMDLNLPGDLPFPSFIEGAQGLLTVEGERGIVRFTHMTIKEYLSDHSSQYFPGGHQLLAETCLTYLSFTAMSDVSDHTRYWRDNDLYPFLQYAAFQWGHHVHKAADDPQTCDLALKWFSSKCFSQLNEIRCHNWPISWLSSRHKAIHEACYFGLASLAVKLLVPGHNVNEPDSMKQTPLHYAARGGHVAVIQVLLKYPNINVNALDQAGDTPLRKAVFFRHDAAANILRQHSVTATPRFVSNELMYAMIGDTSDITSGDIVIPSNSPVVAVKRPRASSVALSMQQRADQIYRGKGAAYTEVPAYTRMQHPPGHTESVVAHTIVETERK
jgi:hypothetical protein